MHVAIAPPHMHMRAQAGLHRIGRHLREVAALGFGEFAIVVIEVHCYPVGVVLQIAFASCAHGQVFGLAQGRHQDGQ